MVIDVHLILISNKLYWKWKTAYISIKYHILMETDSQTLENELMVARESDEGKG